MFSIQQGKSVTIEVNVFLSQNKEYLRKTSK